MEDPLPGAFFPSVEIPDRPLGFYVMPDLLHPVTPGEIDDDGSNAAENAKGNPEIISATWDGMMSRGHPVSGLQQSQRTPFMHR